MGLPKGKTNNPNGRPLGKCNRVTGELRSRIKNFLDENWAQVEKDFKKLDPEKKIIFFEKLLSYAIPKQRETDLKLNLDALTDDQLNTIIDKILNDENSN